MWFVQNKGKYTDPRVYELFSYTQIVSRYFMLCAIAIYIYTYIYIHMNYITTRSLKLLKDTYTCQNFKNLYQFRKWTKLHVSFGLFNNLETLSFN